MRVYLFLAGLSQRLKHVQIQKVLSEGVQLYVFFCFFFWGGGLMRGDRIKIPLKAAIIGLLAKRHLNGVLLKMNAGLVAL